MLCYRCRQTAQLPGQSHLSLFARRLPLNSRLTALPYGGSFHRSLFESYGLFSEELRIGEDTEFALRLPLKARPVWAPDVVTLHRTPTGLRAMLWDQFRRGRLASSHSRQSWRSRIAPSPGYLWRRIADPIKLSRRLGYQKSRARSAKLGCSYRSVRRLLAGCRLAAQCWIGLGRVQFASANETDDTQLALRDRPIPEDRCSRR